MTKTQAKQAANSHAPEVAAEPSDSAQFEEYDATEIDLLKGLEAVRKRPAMYIGDTSSMGLHHLIWEVVDNAVDEAMAGFCNKIDVTIHPDGSCQVVDNGRGIPTDMHEIGRPAAEVVFTELHAGGKFESGAYTISGGLHGVGISVVNALSTRVDAEIRRNDSLFKLSFGDGGVLQSPMQETDRNNTGYPDYDTSPQSPMSEATGTSVQFWPDPAIFEDVTFKAQIIKERLRVMSFLNKGLQIRFCDLRPESKTISADDLVESMDDLDGADLGGTAAASNGLADLDDLDSADLDSTGDDTSSASDTTSDTEL